MSPDRGPDSPEASHALVTRAGERLLLVEDEPSISGPFSRALAREGFVPVVAATAALARAHMRDAPLDLVLLDLMLPDADGCDLARELRAASDVPIIMLTARGSEADRVLGLDVADDYVVKPFALAETIARIRAVLRRSRRQASTATRWSAGEVAIDTAARRVWRAGSELSLTRKEFDLLARLLREPGCVVTREDLMNDVWDVNWFGSTKTLDVHMASLRRKLGEGRGGRECIDTVRGVGYRFAAVEEVAR
ncbi:MAG: response regulator transcription factor [Acidobacteriota bacterium]|nr:response regulator transcription factor [Acidobacteriota bacterium]